MGSAIERKRETGSFESGAADAFGNMGSPCGNFPAIGAVKFADACCLGGSHGWAQLISLHIFLQNGKPRNLTKQVCVSSGKFVSLFEWTHR